MTVDEMVGWHHQLNAHEFDQIPGNSKEQGSLMCCKPWGCRVGNNLVTEQLYMSNMIDNANKLCLFKSEALSSIPIRITRRAFKIC